MRTITAKQALELLAGDPPPVPEGPVESGKGTAKLVFQLVHLLCKA